MPVDKFKSASQHNHCTVLAISAAEVAVALIYANMNVAQFENHTSTSVTTVGSSVTCS